VLFKRKDSLLKQKEALGQLRQQTPEELKEALDELDRKRLLDNERLSRLYQEKCDENIRLMERVGVLQHGKPSRTHELEIETTSIAQELENERLWAENNRLWKENECLREEVSRLENELRSKVP